MKCKARRRDSRAIQPSALWGLGEYDALKKTGMPLAFWALKGGRPARVLQNTIGGALGTTLIEKVAYGGREYFLVQVRHREDWRVQRLVYTPRQWRGALVEGRKYSARERQRRERTRGEHNRHRMNFKCGKGAEEPGKGERARVKVDKKFQPVARKKQKEVTIEDHAQRLKSAWGAR